MIAMQLHIVNYRGAQAHSASRFLRVAGSWICFAAGAAADTGDLQCVGAARFVTEDDPGYLPVSSQVGGGITVTIVSDDGQTITTRTSTGSTVSSSDGRYTTNIGDPGGARRGI